MAVFKLNICKFKNCDMIFNNLENLVRHIETNHINFDPKIIEQFETQQPTCLPLSYVLRFFADPLSEENDSNHSKLKQTLLSPKPIQQKVNSNGDNNNQNASTNNKSTVQSEKKGNSWVKVKTNNRMMKNFCKMKKTFKCHCGKAYGSSTSLKKHAMLCPNAAIITAQVKEILQQGTDGSTLNKLIQPYQSISLKQLSAATTPLKTFIVSTKTNNSSSATPSQSTQQPQRLMIQLSGLNAALST